MIYYDYALLIDSEMDLRTFIGIVRKLAEADIELEWDTLYCCDDAKIYVEAEGGEWDGVKAAIDSIPGVEIDLETMSDWEWEYDPPEEMIE